MRLVPYCGSSTYFAACPSTVKEDIYSTTPLYMLLEQAYSQAKWCFAWKTIVSVLGLTKLWHVTAAQIIASSTQLSYPVPKNLRMFYNICQEKLGHWELLYNRQLGRQVLEVQFSELKSELISRTQVIHHLRTPSEVQPHTLE